MSVDKSAEVRKHIEALDELIERGFDAMCGDMSDEEELRFRAADEFWDSMKEKLAR
ncbi:hypothetical protein ES705_50013 [subsurface metagenome]